MSLSAFFIVYFVRNLSEKTSINNKPLRNHQWLTPNPFKYLRNKGYTIFQPSSPTNKKSDTMCFRDRCISCICGTIITLIFMFIVSSIIFWIIISPSNVKFHITDASLTQFNLTNNNTLYYNFKVNVTVRNPNKKIIVYYRRIKAIAWYKDNDFGTVNLTPFDQGHKNTTFLQVLFEGQSVLKLKPKQLGEYEEETSVGVYNDMAVDFDLRIRAKYARFKSSRFNPPIVQCRRLSVPLISKGKSAPPFSVTKCRIDRSFFVDRNAEAA